MNRFTIRRISILCLSMAFVAALSGAAPCQPCAQWAGKMVSVQGSVEALGAGSSRWQAVNLNDTFCPGETIRVGPRSRADLLLSNQSVLRLDEQSEFTLENVSQEHGARLNMLKGAAHFFSRKPRSLEVETPFTIAGVRGTEFALRIEERRTLLTVYEGIVYAENPLGGLMLKGGQSAEAEAGKAPALRIVARPRDAVMWALHYPPVIYAPPAAAPPSEEDARRITRHASQLLAVGRVEEALVAIERALRRDARASEARALQAIVFVVQNQKEKALEAAALAVRDDPDSATARIALSYAQQAGFDLESARSSLETAVSLDPANALAWARLAELHMSFGHLDRALAAATRAAALDPSLSRTQTVLGFAHLAQVQTQRAREAFERAIVNDQADPLPRLGMGLAIIREGRLREGGEQIEIAASLDPNNSLIRSYLGKTYFEEKRTGLDEREYAIAKELDPNDPTPHFYDAIAKQTTNRPVEALKNYQKAIELNDHRAVYRSRLQLDSDLAARSAALARIYGDLGFWQRALAEGYTSLGTDPASFSAHRFLADSYSALPRHEIARVSELLQSQLLQPLNLTPIQPALAESNLYLISSGGAASLSFNEFNPLFNRNRAAVQAGALAGENQTRAGEGIVSGIYDKVSLSAGYTRFETDGFRQNNHQEDNIANLFGQIQLGYKTSLQAEYRHRKDERGDTQLRFFEEAFLPHLDQEDRVDSIRVGARHEFTPSSVVIGNFSRQTADRRLSDRFFIGLPDLPPLDGHFDQNVDESAYSAELQHIFRSKLLNLVGGGGYFRVDEDAQISQKIYGSFAGPPLLVDSFKEEIHNDIDHSNLYLYTGWNPFSGLSLTLGASGDFFKRDENNRNDRDIEENQFNPKFGVAWSPLSGTTLRGAVFRTLKRTLINDQTLEPTQVAGFNQFFDDINATKAWRYGVGLDQKFTQTLFGGVELSRRDLEVPYFSAPPPPAAPVYERGSVDWKEYLGRAYLYWAPHKWVGLSAEYQYEEFKRDEEFLLYLKEVKTHRLPLGLNLFHPCGLSLAIKATYIHQRGDFETLAGPPGDTVSGDDHFWLVDAALNYRLPKRYGFVTIGVRNLFDQSFEYFDTDADSPMYQPERAMYMKVTLAFP